MVYPVMITPYDENGNVDYGAVKALTKWYYKKGCDGIFAVCQSSEMFQLSLKDRVAIAKTVVETAKELERENGKKMSVVASGHISYDIDEQIEEVVAMSKTGVDSVILISNRFNIANTNEDDWISDLFPFIAKLPQSIKLGMYECPYPYKRVLSEKMMKAIVLSGRFYFMKDTCCNATMIENRVKIIKENHSKMKLLNANGQTLLKTLISGCDGYSGIMCNFHPQLYVWLCENFMKYPQQAKELHNILSMCAFTEGNTYPVTAKYHLKEIEKLPIRSIYSRKTETKELDDYNKMWVEQMNEIATALSNRYLKL